MLRRFFARQPADSASAASVGDTAKSAQTPNAAPEPLSRNWGYDRGQPVDRHYIEAFLQRHSRDVQGRVLEIGDNAYTLRFGGGRVTRSDVLHVTPGYPAATFTGDLTDADHIPDDAFDCIILTQTLQLIYDVPSALRTVRRILKPGGVLLATMPGLTRTSQVEWPNSWYWRFTRSSAERLFSSVFRDAEIETHGNVLAACSFLYGAAAQELAPEDLAAHDPDYDVIVTVRAVKPVTTSPSKTTSTRATAEETLQPGLILLYHRISEPALDPWQLSVSPANFAQHLEVLRAETRIVPLRELRHAQSDLAGDRPAVAITFDDGYADNLFTALPLLQQQNAHATIFVCTDPVARGAEFWWDALERVLLGSSNLPETLEMEIAGRKFAWRLSNAAPHRAQSHDRWRVGEPPPTPRHAAFLELWEQLSRASARERARAMAALFRWAGDAAKQPSRHPPLRRAELQQLASSPLVDFGAHSESHSALSALPLVQQATEITGSARWLAGVTGRAPIAFSYPFGRTIDYTTDTAQLVKAAGFGLACTNVPEAVRAGADPLQLPRVHVADVDGGTFHTQLRQWLTRPS